MKDALQGLHEGSHSQNNRYKFEELCPYPFNREMLRVPFPPYFELPKFEKYKGKDDQRDHAKDFFMSYQEVAYSDNYLIRLFSQSLGGQALEWFLHLPKGSLTTFVNLSTRFIKHFSYNVEHKLTMMDLCNTK